MRINYKVVDYIGTFGGTVAAETLSKICNQKQDPHIVKFIGNRIQLFQDTLKELRNVKNTGIRNHLLKLYRDELFQDIKNCPYDEIKSYLMNHLTALGRDMNREISGEPRQGYR